jgi:hypothetical protein
LTIGIPYSIFFILLQGNSASIDATDEFLNGFRAATIILADLEGIAIIPGVLTEPREAKTGDPGNMISQAIFELHYEEFRGLWHAA